MIEAGAVHDEEIGLIPARCHGVKRELMGVYAGRQQVPHLDVRAANVPGEIVEREDGREDADFRGRRARIASPRGATRRWTTEQSRTIRAPPRSTHGSIDPPESRNSPISSACIASKAAPYRHHERLPQFISLVCGVRAKRRSNPQSQGRQASRATDPIRGVAISILS